MLIGESPLLTEHRTSSSHGSAVQNFFPSIFPTTSPLTSPRRPVPHAIIKSGASAHKAPALFSLKENIMASERQKLANSRNGRLGGPRTEAGKRNSRLNSMKHGLTASTLVILPGEDDREYAGLLDGFRKSLKPVDAVEDALVLRL